jgi:hypothetical protein
MLVRSPRRFVVFCFIGLGFLFVALTRSPWTQERVYERLPILKPENRPGLSWLSGLGSDRLALHPQDAWQHAVPAAMADAVDIALLENEAGALSPIMPSATPSPTESHPPWVTALSQTGVIAPPTPRPADMKEYMRSMLDWARPTWEGHWPPFRDYVDKKYDPSRWEQFDL